jgi:hypothetical protein
LSSTAVSLVERETKTSLLLVGDKLSFYMWERYSMYDMVWYGMKREEKRRRRRRLYDVEEEEMEEFL